MWAAPLRSEQTHVDKVRIGGSDKTIREVVHVSPTTKRRVEPGAVPMLLQTKRWLL